MLDKGTKKMQQKSTYIETYGKSLRYKNTCILTIGTLVSIYRNFNHRTVEMGMI